VRKSDLKFYVARIKRLIKRRNIEKIEYGVRTLHAALLAATREASANRFIFQASEELQKVLTTVAPLECAVTVAAVALLQEYNPRYFVNDRAFDFALVRAFRAQGSLAYGSTWDHREQRMRLWYRPLSPRSTAYAAMFLKECYSPFINAIRREDRTDQLASARATFNEGFAEPAKKRKKQPVRLAPRGAPRKPLVVSPLGTPAQRRST
jgi:hypothetical protein